jgi:hypothetical protein
LKQHQIYKFVCSHLLFFLMQASDPENIVLGNARTAGAKWHGWFMGHFVDSDPALATSAVEVKWGVHAEGDSRTQWSTNRAATTVSILIHGRFRLYFPDREVLLAQEGDYALWLPGVSHNWVAEASSTVLTVRYPSIPGDIME